MTPQEIFTIGYEGATRESLIAALKAAGVTHLADIRHSPYSKRPEFCIEELSAALQAYGLAYSHIRALGNPPLGREAARAGHMAAYREIFTRHLDGPEGSRGLEEVIALACRERVCLLCLEKSAGHCHRGLVAARLESICGVRITHLRAGARTTHPSQGAFGF